MYRNPRATLRNLGLRNPSLMEEDLPARLQLLRRNEQNQVLPHISFSEDLPIIRKPVGDSFWVKKWGIG
jgi:hypothetical protein